MSAKVEIKRMVWVMASSNILARLAATLVFGIFILAVLAFGFQSTGRAIANQGSVQEVKTPFQPASAFNNTGTHNYLPLIYKNYPYTSPFGIESHLALLEGDTIYSRAVDLKVGWARMGIRVSWRKLQPVEGGPINWNELDTFEQELRDLNAARIAPIAVVYDSPHWAVIPNARQDGQLTSCAAVDESHFDDFASFMVQLVERYKSPEFDLHHWEIGNEPDVDPDLVDINSGYGCWGDIEDKFYGGEHYGKALKVITPAIRGADPEAKVWVGGLLLDTPNTTNPGLGKPELFLRGILAAGAAPYFDVLPYHAYTFYQGKVVDHEKYPLSDWKNVGGMVIGKAQFLRGLMSLYGVDKPVFVDETSLFCHVGSYCYSGVAGGPVPAFFEAQADFLVRSMVRGLSASLAGFTWYELPDPDWRYAGLLNGNLSPRPSYNAYQQLAKQMIGTQYLKPVDYGAAFEAYAFKRLPYELHVIWTREQQVPPLNAAVPLGKFVAAYQRDGSQIIPPSDGAGHYLVPVGFSPVYIVRYP